jgi:hypothetical protein
MGALVLAGNTSGSVTVDVPAVAGTNTVTFPAATGTVMVTGNMPAFSAYSATTQSISSGVDTKVLFPSEYFDTNNNFASSRFTPTISGYYQLNASVYSAPNGNTILRLFKNGSVFLEFGRINSNGLGMSGSCLIFANGTTDYFEIYFYSTAASPVIGNSTDPYFVQFSGAMVRGA